MKHFGTLLIAVLWLSAITGCAGGNLTTREKGAGIGALGGGRRSAVSSVPPSVPRESALPSAVRSGLALVR